MIDERYKRINRVIVLFSLCMLIIVTTSFHIYAVDDANIDNIIETDENTDNTIETDTIDDEAPLIENENYVFFDLYYGNVTISGTTYTGTVLVNGVAVKKTYQEEKRKIYIYQSNGSNTVWENGLPKYERVGAPEGSNKSSWGQYITNNNSVSSVITNWDIQAKKVNRASTQYFVNITGGGQYDVTIDNLWSYHHDGGQTRLTGGIGFYPNSTTASKAIITSKGDNRFGNIFYATGSQKNHQIVFKDDGNSTLTVGNLTTGSSANHFNSAIGGSDSAGGDSIGIVFEGGTIFAGTTYSDNCSSIGGGGNATGGVIINGGTITAVTSSTGTAIGGGIGYSSYGGNADVTINGGTIYAYNLGYGSIPSAAIGGGSSRSSNGNTSTTVTINGGTVFAQSTGGVAIGAGGSQLKNGGAATININGGTITAQSIADESKNIQAGSGIGGGTGVEGGDANLTISGDAIVKTGSIGGGKTNTTGGKIGSAIITISGNPTIQGQFIMESEEDATNPCSFLMSGGTIDNSTKTEAFTFLEESGGAIHIVNGVATMEGGTIKNCSGVDGGAVYVSGGDFIMKSGAITNNVTTNEGGAIYVKDGNITIGIEICKGKDDTHSHPIIKENTATNNGGGISITGGQVTMYCGNLIANTAIQNQSGNSVSQTGGVFNVLGGSIGIGIYINDQAIFNDEREGIYQVTYHAIYNTINETMVAEVNSNEKLKLPKENEIENTSFSREGLYLIGWSTNDSSTDGYIVVGSEIYVPQDTDLYAVWGTEPPIAAYTVYIPDTLEISEKDKTGTISISASVKYFTNIASLKVELWNKSNLILEDGNITYRIKENETMKELQNGDTMATFTSTDQSEKKFTAEITGKAKYAGKHTDTLTFMITYSDGSQQ